MNINMDGVYLKHNVRLVGHRASEYSCLLLYIYPSGIGDRATLVFLPWERGGEGGTYEFQARCEHFFWEVR